MADGLSNDEGPSPLSASLVGLAPEDEELLLLLLDVLGWQVLPASVADPLHPPSPLIVFYGKHAVKFDRSIAGDSKCVYVGNPEDPKWIEYINRNDALFLKTPIQIDNVESLILSLIPRNSD